ncbi:hypothetical protein ACVCAH_26550 [Micromonospora sp. LZ34]
MADDDRYAVKRLADLLALRGDLEDQRNLAAADDRYAANRLVDLLVERNETEPAIALLRQQADKADKAAARRLAGLLVDRGTSRGPSSCSGSIPEPPTQG